MAIKLIDPIAKVCDVNAIQKLVSRGSLSIDDQTTYHPCVEAMVMRVPLTGILYETMSGKYVPTENTQRAINAIIAYAENKIALPASTINPDLAGKYYSELPNMYRHYFDSIPIRFLVISYNTPEEKREEVSSLIVSACIV